MKNIRKCGIAATLCACIAITVACSTSWIKVAVADLPVLTEMALDISSFAATAQNQQDAQAQNAIKTISSEASSDLNLFSTLLQQYQSQPTPELLAKITLSVKTINANLPALLAASHIKDATLAQRVTAAVGTILMTVNAFAVLMPKPGQPVAARTVKPQLPTPKDLRRIWNKQVCAGAPDCPKISDGVWEGLGNAIGESLFGGNR